MPRLARIIAMGLVLTGSGWLPAQSFPPAGNGYAPPADSRAALDPSWPRQAQSPPAYAPQASSPASGQDGVAWAEYQASGPFGQTSQDGFQRPVASPTPSPPSQSDAGLPLTPSGQKPPIKMSPPGSSPRDSSARTGGLGSLVTIGSSLAIVLGAFLVFAWLMRRTLPPSAAPLPNDVVEVLGRTIVAHRQQLQLLRFGSKLLLVSVTPGGAETLGEITDPDEVTRLAGLCQQSRPGSSTAAFRQVFAQLAGERT